MIGALDFPFWGPLPDRMLELFSVVPSLNPRSHLKIINWFASGQLGFFVSVVFSAPLALMLCNTAER